ncbi:CopD family protein [Qipengyuania sediminis]|uniref:CopD family protein n=1 Tax=Qipengyuania sediminis TaxID=1532023 RepID=UPI001059E5F6|nr:CopD family protein [Qipengyuania sediminis]
MQDTLAALYPWLKAGHIIFVVFWMAGLFILPRQMLYCLDSAPGSPEETRWAERIALLRRMILTPSLVVVWLLGLLLASAIGAWDQAWLHAKLLLVLGLSAFHAVMVARARRMAAGERPLTARQLRLWGEVPALALVLIVVLVVVKPF